MRKCIKLFILLFIMMFTISVKARTYTEDEYKNLNIGRAYVVCDYVFNMDDRFNPTLKDFLLASQSCPIDQVTVYELKFGTDINGNPSKNYLEVLSGSKLNTFPNLNIKYVYKKSIDNNPNQTLDDTPTNIVNDLDTTPYTEAKFKELNVKRTYVVGAYVFKMGDGFNPTLKDFLLASQSNPKGVATIYEIIYSEDINGNPTSSYKELIEARTLNSFPELNLRYYFWGSIIPNSHNSEKKRDLMTADTITHNLGSYAYNGTSPNIETATATSGLAITYKVYNGSSCSGEEIAEWKNAGTYSVYASTEGNSTYAKASKCTRFIINKKNASGFTVTLEQDVYNFEEGGVYEPNVEIVDTALNYTLVEGTDYTVEYSNNTSTGQAAAIVTYTGNYSGSKISYFTIGEHLIVIQKSNGEYTYDGTNKTFTLTATSPQNVTILYGMSDCSENECTLTEKPQFKNVGTYTVYYIATATGHKNSYGSVQVIISKANDSITCEEQTNLVYNGSPQAINAPTATTPISSVVYYDSNNCTEITNGQGSCSGAYLPSGAPTNAGSYVALITTSGNDNYEGAELYVRHNIAKKNGSLTTVSFENNQVTYTYDNGNPIEPNVIVHDNERNVDLTEGTDYTVTYDNNRYVSDTNAKAIVTFAGNYSGTKTAEFTITQAGLSVNIDYTPVVYDGNSHGITVTAPEADSIQYKVISPSSYATAYSTTNPQFTDANTYVISVKVEKENYQTVEREVSFTITQKQDNVTLAPLNTTYTGYEIPATGATCTSGTTITYSYYTDSNCTQAFSGIPKDVGLYYAKATSAGNNNYSSSWICVSHYIDQKSIADQGIEKTIYPMTFDYDGNYKTPTVTIVDGSVTLVKDTDYTVAYTNNKNASTGDEDTDPRVTVTMMGNYKGSYYTTFGINKVQFSVVAETVAATNGGVKLRVKIRKDSYIDPISNLTVKFGDASNQLTRTATLSDEDETYYIYDDEAKTAIQTYTVYFEVSSANYRTKTGNATFTVNGLPMALVYVQNQQGQNSIPTKYVTTADGYAHDGYVPDISVVDGTNQTITNRTVMYGLTEGTYNIAENDLEPINSGTHTIYFKVTSDGYAPIVGYLTITVSTQP